MCAQGNDSYIVPSIPMANVTTSISRTSSGPMTPRGTRTIGNVANENDDDDDDNDDNDTQPHAEDSIYIEEDDNNDNDDNHINQENKSNEDEDDGKNEIEPETPKGPSERKTSEGNVTFS